MKIYPPFSGAAASLGAAYFTAVLCGVCGIREWGALIVTVLVGALTCAVVNSVDDSPKQYLTAINRMMAAKLEREASAFRDEAPPLPNINQDPLAIEINEAAWAAGIMDKMFIQFPSGHPQANYTYYIPKEKSNDQLEPPL
jgi:hypothetical protein